MSATLKSEAIILFQYVAVDVQTLTLEEKIVQIIYIVSMSRKKDGCRFR